MASNQSILTDRTPHEIVKRIYDIKGVKDISEYPEALQLLKYLSYEDARPFLGGAATEADWEIVVEGLSTPGNEARRRLRPMWAAANEMLLIEVMTNFAQLKALLWLDMKEHVLKDGEAILGQAMGKPLLYLTAKEYDLNWRRMDNDTWFLEPSVMTADEAIKSLFGNSTIEEEA